MRALRLTLVCLALTATGTVTIAIDQAAHSVSDTLYGAVVPVVGIWLLAGIGLALTRGRAVRS